MQQQDAKGLEDMETGHINPHVKRQGKTYFTGQSRTLTQSVKTSLSFEHCSRQNSKNAPPHPLEAQSTVTYTDRETIPVGLLWAHEPWKAEFLWLKAVVRFSENEDAVCCCQFKDGRASTRRKASRSREQPQPMCKRDLSSTNTRNGSDQWLKELGRRFSSRISNYIMSYSKAGLC